MNLAQLREFTPARVGLGRAGSGLPTQELLKLQLAHAKARDAVFAKLDARSLALQMQLVLGGTLGECLLAHSAAPNRDTYLHRPDLGRRLSHDSYQLLTKERGQFDAAFIIADGLSAIAVERHAEPLMESIFRILDSRTWKLTPVVIVEQGRVAIGDEVAECLRSSMSVVLIGERPGLSAPDSLGIYLTWNPHRGSTNADRNCISNIRPGGLSYSVAAQLLLMLMNESRAKKLSGVRLREAAVLGP